MQLTLAAGRSKALNTPTELKCGAESAVLGLSTTIGPILIFLGMFGAQSIEAAFWATLITATVPRGVRLIFGENPAILSSSRAASLTAYVGLVLGLSVSLGNSAQGDHSLSVAQLSLALAAGSMMFAAASCLMFLSGLLKLGNIFKMIPSTVTAGIANSTALVLISLAVKEVLHATWLTGLAALAMMACVRYWPQAQVRAKALKYVPTLVVALLSGFALSIAAGPVTHPSTPAVTYGLGWISVAQWHTVFAATDFKALVLIALPGTLTLALVMILESFTASSLMETRVGVRIDASRELMVLGAANLVSALIGGVPSTAASRISLTNWFSGGRGSLAALSSIAFTATLLLVLGPWLLALPAGIIAGLYVMEAPTLVDPAFKKRLNAMLTKGHWRSEGSADLGFWITFVITVFGFFGSLIWACSVGIALSCLAVLRSVSSKLDAQWAYLDQFRSHRVRSAGEISNLERNAKRVGILRLTGHVFFGNSRRLTEMPDELHADTTAVLVDVSQVHIVDTSGLDALGWLIRALLDRKVFVVLTGTQRTPSKELRRAMDSIQGVEMRVDMDRGLELCEEQLLQNSTVIAIAPLAVPLEANALLKNLAPDEVTGVLMLGDRREVPKGEALFRKDTLADGVWLLEEGTVSILSASFDEAQASRLATFGPGQFVGEMSLIDGRLRSATVLADSPVRALLLDKHAIGALEERYPSAALHITRNIAHELSHRVRSTSALMTEVHTEKVTEWANSSLSTLSRF
jgi:SulP family sulfate permease